MKSGLISLGAATGALVLGLAALAVEPVMQLADASAQAAPDGKAIYDARCKSCHEGGDERTPPPSVLSQRTHQSIVDALTNGVMAPMAAGLSPAEISAVATFLTAQAPRPAATAQPASPAAQPATPAAGRGGGRGGAAPPAAAAARPPVQQPADPMCSVHPPIRASASSWNGFGGAQNLRLQTNTGGLRAAHVPKLKPKWTFSLGGGRYGQPTVIGNHLFVTTGLGHLFALDADTGCVHWRADVQPSRTSPVVEQRRGASPSGWVVYIGNRDRDVMALDAMTGKQLWKVNVESHPRSVLTGSPILHGDILYQPTSSGEETMGGTASYECCTFVGSVVAIDVKTGKILWKTPMLDTPRPTRKNEAGTQMYGPAGAAIWSQPTVDAKRNQLLVATGDSYTEIDAPRTDAIVALDLKTGAIKWHNQVTANDNFLIGCGAQRRGVNCPLGETGPDFDYGASPIVRTVGGRDLVLSGQKSGIAYAMDALTGRTIWQNKVGVGGPLGGIEWGMAADNRTLYVTNADIGRPNGKPGLTAIDVATGRTKWHQAAPPAKCGFSSGRCSNAFSAPPTIMPGAVFAGSLDGWLRAYDPATGKVLWEYDAGGATFQTVNGVMDQKGANFDATGPVIADGKLFVINGYSGASSSSPNALNTLIAFSVDGK